MTLDFHPAAAEFPQMDAKRFAELKADIAENGCHIPLTLLDGKVLDGRNRYRACHELGMPFDVEEYDGDPWAYVWSLNGQRRDLSADQRALIWVHCNAQSEAWQAEQDRVRDEANRKRSEATSAQPRTENKTRLAAGDGPTWAATREDSHPTRKAKAAASQTSASAIERAERMTRERPDLAEQVRKGDLKPAAARRQMQKDAVAEKVASLPPELFRVLYADPPWKYGNEWQGGTNEFKERWTSAATHYASMTIAELCALPVKEHIQDDAVLFLWVTSPMLAECFEVIRAWGFAYKASVVWDKVRHNFGHYVSVRHEFLLICTRGSCTPDSKELLDSVVTLERTPRHSEKPEEFRAMIDALYPHGKRLELFARTKAEGWESYGAELPD